MDGNKDEADHCIELAILALKTGHIERAEKFLRKANNLFPSQRCTELLERITTQSNEPSYSKSAEKTRKRRPNPPMNENKTHEIDYSQAQLEMVQRINRCTDYYEVLNVTTESTDSEIKKAYKRLALQLHPDKNSAPGAVESFKAVGNAVAVLTDPDKRKVYDMYTSKDKYHNAPRTHPHHFDNHEYEHAYARNGFESDFTAEELFNMFFGSQPRAHPTHSNHRHRNHDSVQQPSLAFGLILVLIVISMLTSFFTSDPLYSLSASSRYPMRRHTNHLQIPYFVKDKFDSEYQGSLARLEHSVEEEYISVLKQSCYRERSYREVMIARARSFGSKANVEQANNLKVPSCENLAKIGLTKFYPY